MAVPNFMYRPNAASYGRYVLVDCKLSTRPYTERKMSVDCNVARRLLEFRPLGRIVPNHELATSNSTRYIYKGHLQNILLNHNHLL